MESIWESILIGVHFFLQHFMFWNIIFAIIIVFFQRREPKSVWAWLLLLYFIPVLGFLFYLMLGADLHKRKMFRVKEVDDQLNEAVKQQEYKLKVKKSEELNQNISNYKDLIMYNLETSGSVLTKDNKNQILYRKSFE